MQNYFKTAANQLARAGATFIAKKAWSNRKNINLAGLFTRARPFYTAPARMPRYAKRRRTTRRRSYRRPYSGRGKFRRVGFYGRYNSSPGREMKFFDSTFTVSGVNLVGELNSSINLVPQGTGESERIGRKMTIRSIDWRFTIRKLQETGAVGSDTVRVIMFLDTQANGAAAVPGDILEATDYQAFYNLTNSGRFRILMDRTYDSNVKAGSGNGSVDQTFSHQIHGRFSKKCSIPIEYSSTTGAITEIRSNNIGVVLFAERDQGSDFVSRIRIRFTG